MTMTIDELKANVEEGALVVEGVMCARDGRIIAACAHCTHTAEHELSPLGWDSKRSEAAVRRAWQRTAHEAYDELVIHLIAHGAERPTVRFVQPAVTRIGCEWGRVL